MTALGQSRREASAVWESWKTGQIKLQIAAICALDSFPHWETVGTLCCLEQFYQRLENDWPEAQWLRWQEDLGNWQNSDKLGLLLALEGAEPLEGQIELLHLFFRLGIRMLGLTWNYRNQLADGVKEQGGLSSLGKQFVREMNRMGILLDAAHLAEKGFADLLELTSKPLIVSHANCRRLCDHPRNLADWQIKACAASGGVIGICFYPPFLTGTSQASLEDVLDQIEYLAKVGGVDCVALGSDFDGMNWVPEGLEDVSKMPLLIEGLYKRGFSEKEIALIMGKNWLRVLQLPPKPQNHLLD
ncbi:MAG: dipeptidase [Clostridia bacterium]|nr:dipeptidase [Clostridia bacterium]